MSATPGLMLVPRDLIRQLAESRKALGAVAVARGSTLHDLLVARAKLTCAVDGVLQYWNTSATPRAGDLRSDLITLVREHGALSAARAALLLQRRADVVRPLLRQLAVAGQLKMKQIGRGGVLFEIRKGVDRG